MTDPLIITSIIASVGALILGVIGHLRMSECCGSKFVFKSSKNNSPMQTPKTSAPNENTAFLIHEIQPVEHNTQPIQIPTRPITSPFKPNKIAPI
jgi:hypothetical protein